MSDQRPDPDVVVLVMRYHLPKEDTREFTRCGRWVGGSPYEPRSVVDRTQARYGIGPCGICFRGQQ